MRTVYWFRSVGSPRAAKKFVAPEEKFGVGMYYS